MSIFTDKRFITALAGVIAAGIAIKLPSIPEATAYQIATGIVTFVLGLLLPNPKGPTDAGK